MKPISAYFGSDRPKRTKKEPAKESEPKEEKPKRGKRKAEVHDQKEEAEKEKEEGEKKEETNDAPQDGAAAEEEKGDAGESKNKKAKSNANVSSSASSSDSADVNWTVPASVPYSEMEKGLHPTWAKMLEGEFKKPYWTSLKKFLNDEENKKHKIYPPKEKIFNAFNLCPFNEVKVVLIGQDPYHGDGQAEGLCFSVPKGIAVPPSLRNMYKELSSDIKGFSAPKHGHLEKWGKQGVLLLNATLTVQAANANSHAKAGWQDFTDAVIDLINTKKTGVVFILWGSFAQKKASKVNKSKHRVLSGVHPSGLSANKGFFGCKHFSKCNNLLRELAKTPIDWKLD